MDQKLVCVVTIHGIGFQQPPNDGAGTPGYADDLHNALKACLPQGYLGDDPYRTVRGPIYVQSDPARMYGVMRQTTKPCFAFKVLAAGRIADGGIEQAFRTAFNSIKPNDGIFVGMFPRAKDEVRENAEIVHRILVG